jgi:hypothetical protein
MGYGTGTPERLFATPNNSVVVPGLILSGIRSSVTTLMGYQYWQHSRISYVCPFSFRIGVAIVGS